uniref:U2A'/phosphoprotein 32 family A C-terminal domain-containing protein n=1 Tax=Sinocyclocheilus grahami TaxID=75366 RepID=A0A672NIR2_SINGR
SGPKDLQDAENERRQPEEEGPSSLTLIISHASPGPRAKPLIIHNNHSTPSRLQELQSLLTESQFTNAPDSLEKLGTLILDCNNYSAHVKFPYMPSLTTLWINKNKISNLPIIVEEICCKFPNIKILSMMNNEAAPSYFNGGSFTQYMDYREYVISQIPGLEVLDDTEVQEKEREVARKTYRMQRMREGSRRRKDLHR